MKNYTAGTTNPRLRAVRRGGERRNRGNLRRGLPARSARSCTAPTTSPARLVLAYRRAGQQVVVVRVRCAGRTVLARVRVRHLRLVRQPGRPCPSPSRRKRAGAGTFGAWRRLSRSRGTCRATGAGREPQIPPAEAAEDHVSQGRRAPEDRAGDGPIRGDVQGRRGAQALAVTKIGRPPACCRTRRTPPAPPAGSPRARGPGLPP